MRERSPRPPAGCSLARAILTVCELYMAAERCIAATVSAYLIVILISLFLRRHVLSSHFTVKKRAPPALVHQTRPLPPLSHLRGGYCEGVIIWMIGWGVFTCCGIVPLADVRVFHSLQC